MTQIAHLPEVQVFHPIVAKWLDQNGYDAQHHVAMPEYGIADFVATERETGQVWVVECKSNESTSSAQGALQVVGYSNQIPNSRPMLIIPIDYRANSLRKACARYSVEVVEIDPSGFEEVPSHPVESAFATLKTALWMSAYVLRDKGVYDFTIGEQIHVIGLFIAGDVQKCHSALLPHFPVQLIIPQMAIIAYNNQLNGFLRLSKTEWIAFMGDILGIDLATGKHLLQGAL